MNFPSLKQLLGSAILARHLIGQRRRPFLRRDRLNELRDRRIRQLVRYAAANVPYYREWFGSQGLDPRQIKGAVDLSRIPILDKELVRTQPERFRAEHSAARHAVSFLTSGTTGVPIEIWHDRQSLLANIAFGERERDPVNQICGGSFRPAELYVGYETSTFKKVTDFYAENVHLPVRPLRRYVSLSEPVEHIAELINQEGPDILVGYGGWIDLFFRTVAARQIDLRLPKMVMYMGEALPFGARDRIENELRVPVLSRYNAVEAFKIGFYCQRRSGFHLHEDLCHLRIVNPSGVDVADGEIGEVVISNLVNRATVLLNYPMGDMASLATGPCGCGRTFRLLSELQGRTEDILALENGRFIHPRAVWQVFKPERQLLQYQLIQQPANRYTLELVTLHRESYGQILERVLPRLVELLGADAEIEAHWRANVIRHTGQKFRAVVSAQGDR